MQDNPMSLPFLHKTPFPWYNSAELSFGFFWTTYILSTPSSTTHNAGWGITYAAVSVWLGNKRMEKGTGVSVCCSSTRLATVNQDDDIVTRSGIVNAYSPPQCLLHVWLDGRVADWLTTVRWDECTVECRHQTLDNEKSSFPATYTSGEKLCVGGSSKFSLWKNSTLQSTSIPVMSFRWSPFVSDKAFSLCGWQVSLIGELHTDTNIQKE